MKNDIKSIACGIEHHAILFALLMKYAMEACKEAGWRAAQEGVTRYGEERGQRMAKRAQANGEPITMTACQAYGEWIPEFEGQMVSRFEISQSTLQTHVTKCAWCDAWEKHDLLKYGKYYCVTVDDALARGFSPELRCRPLANISWGAETCILDWCTPSSEKEIEALLQKKKLLGKSDTKDFNFHTAHLLHTVGGAIKQLGSKGEGAVEKAIDHFIRMFGEEYYHAFKDMYFEI